MHRVGTKALTMATAVLASAGLFSQAQENPLGAMATGDSRDATAIAQAQPPAAQDAETPAQAFAADPAQAAEIALSGDEWNIKRIILAGDNTSFVNKKIFPDAPRSIALRVRAELMDRDEPIDSALVEAALADIQDALHREQYYLAQVKVVEFDREEGALTIQVDPGFLGEVRVRFNDPGAPFGEPATGYDQFNDLAADGRWFSQAQVERKFNALRSDRRETYYSESGDNYQVFNYGNLHKLISDINAHPDFKLDTFIRAEPAKVGGLDSRVAHLDFIAREQNPFHGLLEINNYGEESVSKWRANAMFQYLNPFKQDDVWTINPGMSLDAKLFSVASSYMIPNDWGRGGSTTLFAGYTWLGATDIVPRVNLDGRGWFVGASQGYNLIDNRKRLVSVSAGVTYRYIDDQFSVDVDRRGHYESLQKRDITVLPLTLSLNYADRANDCLNGRNFATLSGIYNLRAGGSNTLDDFWVGAKDHYVVGRLQVARLQPLNLLGSYERGEPSRQWTVFLKGEGQITNEPLIPAEKLFIGGYHSVRGYQAKSRLGDNGVYGTVELRTPVLMDLVSQAFRSGDGARKMPIDRLQFLLFVDAGHTQTLKPLPGMARSNNLLSTGLGVRLALMKYAQIRYDAALPLIHKGDDDDSLYHYISVQGQF